MVCLLGDADYERSLRKRLIRGVAPRMELHLWELAFGRPRVEPEEAPEGAGASADLAQILEKLGEPKNSSHLSASPGPRPSRGRIVSPGRTAPADPAQR